MGLFDFLQPDVEMLEQAGDIRGLLKALTYKSKPGIRSRAADALHGLLQKHPDPLAVEPLLGALRDPDHYVRRAAARTLSAFRDDKTLTALADALRAPANWQKPSVAITVAQSLAAVGSSKAAKPVIAALHQARQTSAANDLGEPLAGDFAQALAEFKEMAVITLIAQDPDSDVRLSSVSSLGKHAYSNENVDAFNILLGMLDDPEESVRAAAISQLKYLHDRPFLERMLTAGDAEIRAYAQAELIEVTTRAARQEEYERREEAKPVHVRTIERNLTSPTQDSIRTALSVARHHAEELPANLVARFVDLHRQASQATHNKYFPNYPFWFDLKAPIEDLIKRIAQFPQHHAALRGARAVSLASPADADPFDDTPHSIAGRAAGAETARLIDSLIPM